MTHHTNEDRRKLVETAAGMGLPIEQIGTLLGISGRTCAKRYRKQIDMGKAKANLEVGKTLFTKAVRDRDTGSLIWWTKTQMRWKEEPTEITGKNGAPIAFSAVSREELMQEIIAQMALERQEPDALPAIEHESMKDITPKKLNGKSNGKGNGHG